MNTKKDAKKYIASVKMSPTMLATMSATILGSKEEMIRHKFEVFKKSENSP